jgi:Flp pilus assembly protein TadD
LVHSKLGRALGDQGDFRGAMEHFRQALTLDPKDAEVHHNLAYSLAKTREYDEAIKHYREAIVIDPNDTGAQVGIGIALRDKGDLDGAAHHLRRVVAAKPSDATARYNLGCVLFEKRELDSAAEEFRQALEIRPGDFNAHYNLGVTLAQKRDFDGALKHFQQALAVDAQKSDIHAQAGRCALAVATQADAPKRPESEKEKLRKKAIGWLWKELALLSQRLPTEPDDVQKTLEGWGQDSILRTLRDQQFRARLVPEEQAAWRKLCDEAEALSRQAAELSRQRKP